MIRGRCPICKKAFETESLDQWPSFPFCSARCKLIDLGRWIDGSYTIPGPAAPPPTGAVGREDTEDEDD